MYEPRSEAQAIAELLRETAASLPPSKRLKIPGAAREVLGLHKAELLSIVAHWLAATVGIENEEILSTAYRLWTGHTREEQFVASRILARRPDAVGPLSWNRVRPWLDDVDSVEGADAAAIYVIGPWAAHDLQPRLPALRTLLSPDDLVGRRVALIVTAAIRSVEGYPEVAREFVEATIDDSEPLVIDGIVWALCALARHHRPLVEAFLAEHEELNPLAREQVENWLHTGSRSGLVGREWRLPGRDESETRRHRRDGP